jgi:tRNA (guanine-N7-)-methyltransferase
VGSKNKLKRFRENETFHNVIQPTRSEVINGFALKGKWHDFFQNKNPIVLELGCGKGEYTIALAQKTPNINYIGVDIKGARFWRGAKTATEENLKNVAFLRTQIELIDLCFGIGEVSEIWITFPDPQIKFTRTVHRLTNIDFLKKYNQILEKDGFVHLKTDSEYMHGFTIGLLKGLKQEIVYAHHNIYNNNEAPKEVVSTQTFYEKKFLEKEKAITYLKFRLNL